MHMMERQCARREENVNQVHHMLSHKTSLTGFRNNEVLQNRFFVHSEINSEININTANRWKLNNSLENRAYQKCIGSIYSSALRDFMTLHADI